MNPALGAHAEDVAALRGDFGGSVWTVSFDLRLNSGTFDDVMLRFRYQDFGFNGWSYDFDEVLGQYGVWHTLSVTFDADWTDDEAIAAGWVQAPLAAVGFAQTMSNVYWTEVRLEMPADASFGSANLDNFRLQRVPEPGSMALALGALGALVTAGGTGAAVRRRRVA